jgi:hypothetical protein
MVPIIRPSAQQTGKETNMSRLRHTGTLRTLSFAIGVTSALISSVHAQSGSDDRMPADPPGLRLALEQWPIVAGHRRPPTAVGIDGFTPEDGTASGKLLSRAKDSEVEQLYDEIMRQTDAMIRP